MGQTQFIVAQLGARMHYAVPRILQACGQLERLFTDICAVRGWPRLLKLVPTQLRSEPISRLLSRVPIGVPSNRVAAFNNIGYQYARRRNSNPSEDQLSVHLWAGREFCRRILDAGLGSATGVFTFNSAGLELLHAAKREGLRAVMEQTIAPMNVELQLLSDEAARFPGWEGSTKIEGTCAALYCDREQSEWQLADIILCGSDFVRDGIAQCGGPVEKCVVVPYGVDSPIPKSEPRKRERSAPLHVLTVGSVGLRKGSPYVLQAAQRLKGEAVFRMVGHIGVENEAELQLREHLELVGAVPKGELSRHFAWADVLLLPSLCEGSATVTYEALACARPVICTHNTGSVARDGLEGFIIPIRDSAAIVEKIRQLREDHDLLRQLSENAMVRASEFTIAEYGGRLINALHMGCN